jgi:PadR family transcriptional regulator PadR
MEPTLLLLLHEDRRHGYDLLERLEDFGLSGMDPSVVYRALRDMEAREWVTSTWDTERTQGPPRRVYRLTALGDETLASWVHDLEEAQKRIQHLLDTYRQHMRDAEGEHH